MTKRRIAIALFAPSLLALSCADPSAPKTPTTDSVTLTTSSSTTAASYFQSTFGLTTSSVSWGDMHTHTYYSGDAVYNSLKPGDPNTATPSSVHSIARSRGFTFSATSDHAEAPVPGQVRDGTANVWASTRKTDIADDDETTTDGTPVFVPFMGYEYTNPYPCTDSNPGDGIDECPTATTDTGASCTCVPGDATDMGECSCAGGDESCSGFGHKNVIFRSLTTAPSQRISFLDPATWSTTSSADCTGFNPSNYCNFASYTLHANDNHDLWAQLHAQGFGNSTATQGQAVTIIHTPGNIHHTDWNLEPDPAFVRNIEIFSKWGNSEGNAPASCASPDVPAVSLPTEKENDPDSLIRYQLDVRWMQGGDENYAFSFVGGSDDHTGDPAGDGTGGAGVMGLITSTITRDGLFDALYARHTLGATYYASGPLPVLFALQVGSQNLLGGDLGNASTDGTATLYTLGTSAAQQLEIIVDGCNTTPTPLSGATQVVKLTGLSSTSRHYVYVRVRTATTGSTTAETAYNQTWSSPVYIRSAQ